jgi:hypothetical protein
MPGGELMATESLFAVLLFAAIFLFGRYLHSTLSRPTALSLGAGVATAYVFVRMLPEIDEAGHIFVEVTAHRAPPTPELRVYLSALAGFILFFGLENMVERSRERALVQGRKQGGLGAVVIVDFGGFALYIWLVCYLIVRGITEEPLPVAFYAMAMGLHFLGIDHTLSREHPVDYPRVGRFVLAAAAVTGWGFAMLMEFEKPVVITAFGFVSGGVLMNSMITELPREKTALFWPFLLGAAGYATLLVLIH